MNEQERANEHQWARKMLALEEEQGPILPAGAAGGAGLRKRTQGERGAASVALRARVNVRFLARAVPASNERAA